MIILDINFVIHRHSIKAIHNRGLLQIVFHSLNASCMNFLYFNIDWSKLRTVDYAFAAIKPYFKNVFDTHSYTISRQASMQKSEIEIK